MYALEKFQPCMPELQPFKAATTERSANIEKIKLQALTKTAVAYKHNVQGSNFAIMFVMNRKIYTVVSFFFHLFSLL